MIVSQETALLVWILRPSIDTLFVRYRVPPTAGIEILEEVLRTLDRKWSEIHDRPEWLLQALRVSCLGYWRQRRRRIYSAIGPDLLF